MSVAVTMKGMLNAIHLEDDFASTINAINMAAAMGKTLLIGDSVDGRPVALHVENILSIEDMDSDD